MSNYYLRIYIKSYIPDVDFNNLIKYILSDERLQTKITKYEIINVKDFDIESRLFDAERHHIFVVNNNIKLCEQEKYCLDECNFHKESICRGSDITAVKNNLVSFINTFLKSMQLELEDMKDEIIIID